MNDIIKSNIKNRLLEFLPVVSSVVFVIIFNIHLNPFVSSNIRPSISIICIYFWLVNSHNIFGMFSVYVIAIVEEMISSTPLGSSILTALILYLVVTLIHKFVYHKPFLIFWYGFMFSCFISLLSKWIIISIYYGEALSISTTIFTIMSTIAFFPIFGIINTYIYKNFMRRR